jgi:hypothetical protein
MRKFLTMLLLSFLFMGCTAVKPWEKETLAKPIMQFGGLNTQANTFESHVYFSKEASRGGDGVAGGGCGCN